MLLEQTYSDYIENTFAKQYYLVYLSLNLVDSATMKNENCPRQSSNHCLKTMGGGGRREINLRGLKQLANNRTKTRPRT